jgi:hypothetical protein
MGIFLGIEIGNRKIKNIINQIVTTIFDSWCRTIRSIKKGSPKGGPFFVWVSAAPNVSYLKRAEPPAGGDALSMQSRQILQIPTPDWPRPRYSHRLHFGRSRARLVYSYEPTGTDCLAATAGANQDSIERIELARRAAISNHMGPIRGERGPLAGQVSTSRTTMPLNTARSL